VKRSYPTTDPAAKSFERDFGTELDRLCREKISELVQAYLCFEVDELLTRRRYERSSDDSAKAYRNGFDDPRTITTSAGPIKIRRPRVVGIKHESAVLPKFVRRLPSVDRTLHQLWIEGLADRDFERSLRGLLGESAPLSASTIARTNAKFIDEYTTWCKRSLAGHDYVYVWADGIHLGAGPDDERRVLLVLIAADANGIKHFLALEEAMSESEQSWADLLEKLKERGLRPPQLLVADGANGLWVAATKAFPDTAQQRCWIQKNRSAPGDRQSSRRCKSATMKGVAIHIVLKPCTVVREKYREASVEARVGQPLSRESLYHPGAPTQFRLRKAAHVHALSQACTWLYAV